MNYCDIKKLDTANGEGIRVSLFVSGCTNHCEGCFNPETWDFNYGKEFNSDVAFEIVNLMDHDWIDGITVLGGEPMEPSNQLAVYSLLTIIKWKFGNKKNIWMYTGFRYEDLLNSDYCKHTFVTEKILSMVDILVDGKFEIAKKDLNLKFRGSSNQRIIDLNRTRERGTIVPWEVC